MKTQETAFAVMWSNRLLKELSRLCSNGHQHYGIIWTERAEAIWPALRGGGDWGKGQQTTGGAGEERLTEEVRWGREGWKYHLIMQFLPLLPSPDSICPSTHPDNIYQLLFLPDPFISPVNFGYILFLSWWRFPTWNTDYGCCSTHWVSPANCLLLL